MVFEQDRFVIVTANEIAENDTTVLPKMGVDFFNTRDPKNGTEKAYILDLYFRGISTTTIPSWWRPYASALPKIKTRAKPVSLLLTARPQNKSAILQLSETYKKPLSDLYFLPFVHPKDMTWIAILDNSYSIIGYLHVDGFI